MNSIWTIRHESSGLTKTASEWKISDINVDLTSQGADSASLFLDGKDYDSTDLWSYKDEVTIYRDGQAWFRGVVVSTPRSGRPDYEGAEYQLAGGWWWFENTAYLKEWASLTTTEVEGETVAGSDSQYLGYARLFIDNNGDGVSTSAALTELVNYAISAGVPVMLGSLPANTIIPWPSDVRDASVAQVIQQILRWHPDVTPWFDYSTSPPTLNFDERSGAETLTLNADRNNHVRDVNIRSRDDLKPAAVCIHYEITDKVDDKQYRRISHDLAPGGQSCVQPGAVNVTIPLRGRQITTQTESVRVTEIPDNGGDLMSSSDKGREWWRRHYSMLQDKTIFSDALLKVIVDPDPDKVVQFAQELEEDHPEDPLLEEGRKLKEPLLPSDYPNELVDGALDDWMEVHARELVVRSKIYYLGDIEDLPKELRAQFPLLDTSENATTGGKYYNTAEVTVMGTDAWTKNYKRTVSFHEAETVPEGLAQHMYNQLSLLQWEGSVTLVQKEAGDQRIMGKSLNIQSGHPAWETMQAQIWQVSYNLSSGTTTIAFGPPQNLTTQDFVEQLRLGKVVEFVFKEKPGDAELNTRDGKQIVGGYIQPKANSLWGPGGASDLGRSCLTPKSFVIPEDAAEPVKLTLNPCQMASFGNNDGGVMHPIKYGMETLDDDPAPEIELVEGENTIWAKWDTDENGVVEADTVEVTLTEPTGRRAHVPASPEASSQTGKYSQKCLVVDVSEPDDPGEGETEDGSTRLVTWRPVSPGLIWNVFDRAMESVGSAAKVASTITNDRMQFRSIAGSGTSEPSAGTNEVVKELYIKTEEDGQEVKITGKVVVPTGGGGSGSGETGSLTINDCDGSQLFKLDWADGLITTAGNTTLALLPCSKVEKKTMSYCDNGVKTDEFYIVK